MSAMNPYLDIIHDVVDRLRSSEPFATPPAVLVVPEEDEPDPDRPGQGDAMVNAVDTALAKAGVVVVVYLESVDLSGQRADVVELRVQITEHVVNNRHERGCQKPSLQLALAARALLDGWQSATHPEWAPLRFLGLNTVTTGTPLIRELRLQTMTFMRLSTSPEN